MGPFRRSSSLMLSYTRMRAHGNDCKATRNLEIDPVTNVSGSRYNCLALARDAR